MRAYNITLKRGAMVCKETVVTNPFGLLLYRWKMSKLWKVEVK